MLRLIYGSQTRALKKTSIQYVQISEIILLLLVALYKRLGREMNADITEEL